MTIQVFVATVIVGLTSLFFSGTGYAQDKGKGGNEGVTQLYNAARKEGRVVIWGPTDAIVYQRMQEALNKQYPGIKIESFESIPEPLVQRIIAESQAGKPAAVDVIQSGSLRALRPLIDRDMLAPYPGWEQLFGSDAVYADQRLVGGYNLTLPIAYNTKTVSAQEAPRTWEDLADPKWKGRKIIIEARLVPFAMLGTGPLPTRSRKAGAVTWGHGPRSTHVRVVQKMSSDRYMSGSVIDLRLVETTNT